MAWDVDSLKEYMDARLEDQQQAVIVATAANEKRLDAVNEFRAQLNDQALSFLTRNEYAPQHQALAKRIDDLTDRFNITTGKSSGMNSSWLLLTGAVGLGAGIIAIIYYVSHLH